MRWPLACLLLLSAAAAQSAYITDKLVAGLYPSAARSEQPLRALQSGMPLEVLERGREFARVRTGDGQVGWVETAYLTDEKPARTMLLEAQARAGRLQQRLHALQSGKAALPEEQPLSADAPLDDGGTGLQAALEAAQARIDALEIALQSARDGQEQAQLRAIVGAAEPAPANDPVDSRWCWAGPLLGLLAGILLGGWLTLRRLRRRFGGLDL